ncbi:hypothetical protein BO82DRAFT_399253 [Aspergillus uvarum CBS 121591]|uniref:Uncharacterized protein n=1 Tax=Aspergillus uvarum CBS 121591 TaxID=1448315 RepID=A0A319CKA1_9EURO|nr:hypothetical protein BO82DRAFT_399253 [Aspergillus uvarum CBS 121591]PYH84839.1 hypothetical protein BO82DRAFT_399253 [Aspergillus uvarum CBS 121591]
MENYIIGVNTNDPASKECRDINWSINTCKFIMFAMDYVTATDTSNILVTQAERVGSYFDDIESYLAIIPNPIPDQRLDLGTKWRRFMYLNWDLQAKKATSEFTYYIRLSPRLGPHNLRGLPLDADGDIELGGIETNEDILARIKAVASAWEAFPRSFANPFPSTW